MLKPTPSKPGLFSVAFKRFSCLKGIAVVALMTLTLSVLYLSLVIPPKAYATTNATLNFQARLESSSGAIAPDGTYNTEFKLYSASSGGSAEWTEDYLVSATQGVKVANGYLTVNLGSLTAFPNTINWGTPQYLTMNIGNLTSCSPFSTCSPDGEMSPRLPLTSVPSAFSLESNINASGFNSNLTLTQPGSGVTTGNENFVVQDQGAAGTYSLLTGGSISGATAGVVLQGTSPGSVQTGNFNVSGVGMVGSLQVATSGNIDVAASGTLTIGAANATTINIGTNAINHTIQIGNGAAVEVLTIGSTNTTSSTSIQGGTGGSINIGSVGSSTLSSTTHIADTSNATGQQVVYVGSSSTNTGNQTTLQAGPNQIQINNTGSNSIIIQGTTPNNGNMLLVQSTSTPVGGGSLGTFFADTTSNVNALQAVSLVGQTASTPVLNVQSYNSGTLTSMFSVGATGQVTAKNLTNSTTAFQVQNASGVAALNVDTTTNELTITSSGAAAILGSELITTTDFTNAAWTSTGWATTTTTATHNTGNTSALSSNQFTAVAGNTYQVTFTITGSPTAGTTVTPYIGAVPGRPISGNVTNEVEIITAAGTTTPDVSFVPTSTWNGTISAVSVKQITGSNAGLSVIDATSSFPIEVRTSGVFGNTFVGHGSGQNNTTGNQNTGLGDGALYTDTTGHENTATGRNALEFNTTGNYNTAIGRLGLQSNISGSNNTALGYSAGISNVTGSNNTFIGTNADLGSSVVGQLQNAAAIGAFATVSQNNSIALGCVNGTNSCTTNTLVGVDTASPGATLDVQAVSSNVGLNVNTTGTGNLLQLQNAGVAVATITSTGATTLKNSTNSTSAFQVQATGGNVFTIDTTNNALVLGNDVTTSALTVRGGAATGNNINGSNITFNASNGTGAGGSGSFIFQTAKAGGNSIGTDNTATTFITAGTSLTTSFTTGSQTNRFMIVQLVTLTGRSFTGVTYNGVALTRLTTKTSANAYEEVWYLVGPATGTHNLVGTENTAGEASMEAATFYNVDPTTPLGTAATAAGTTTGTQPTSLNVSTSTTAQVVVDAIAIDTAAGTSLSNGTGQTQLWNYAAGSGAFVSGSAYKSGTGGTVNMSWNVTSSDWADIGVPLNPTSNSTQDTLSPTLVMNAAGNVGIDNSNPQYSLDVAGTARIQTTTDSTNAFQIQNSSGVTILNVDTNGNAVTIGNTGSTLTLEGGTGTSAIQIGNGATAHGIQIGTGAAAETVTVGSTNTTSATTINAGSGNITLNGFTTINQAGIPLNINSTGGTPEAGITLQSAGTTKGEIGIAGSTGHILNQTGPGDLAFKSLSGNILFGASSTSDAQLTLSTNGNLTLSAGLLVLDNASSAPTEIDGGMYYSTSDNTFECGDNGSWTSCGNGVLGVLTADSSPGLTTNSYTNFSGASFTPPSGDCQPGVSYLITADGFSNSGTAGTSIVMDFALYQNTTPTATDLEDMHNESTLTSVADTNYHSWTWNMTVTCQTLNSVMIQGFATSDGNRGSGMDSPAGNARTAVVSITPGVTFQLKGRWRTTPTGSGFAIVMTNFIVQRLAP